MFFASIKKDYDTWFYMLIDVFQGIEESVCSLEKLQWAIKDRYEELKIKDERCKWGMYSSAIITLLGMPVTGYSVALALSSGSFKYKRYLINQEIEELLKYQEMNAKSLRVLHEKEDLMRKLIDI